MSEDATLDAFENGESEDDSASADDAEPTDPAPVTSSWRADATCSACVGSAPRRWTDGDGRVCADCAPWATTGSEPCDQ